MSKINVTETVVQDAEAAEIVLPAEVVMDEDGNVIGTVSLTLEKVFKSVLSKGEREKVDTGATRLMANFVPASKAERRFSARWVHLAAVVEALAPHFSEEEEEEAPAPAPEKAKK